MTEFEAIQLLELLEKLRQHINCGTVNNNFDTSPIEQVENIVADNFIFNR